MSKNRKILLVIQAAICASGLLLQVNEVSNGYFKFMTESKVQISIHSKIETPSLSFCFYTDSIIRLDQLKVKKFDGMIEGLTIKDFLELTPPSDQIFKNGSSDNICGFGIYKRTLEIKDISDCYEAFNVAKYYYQQSICYHASLKYNNYTERYRYIDIKNTFFIPGDYNTIFWMTLNDSLFTNVKLMYAFVHERESVPILDSAVAHSIHIKTLHNFLRVTYQTIVIKNLEPPYDTMCHSYPTKSSRTHMNCHIRSNKSGHKQDVRTRNTGHHDRRSDQFETVTATNVDEK